MTATEPIAAPTRDICPPCPPTNGLVCPFCGRVPTPTAQRLIDREPDRDDPDYGNWAQRQVDHADNHIDQLIEAGEWT